MIRFEVAKQINYMLTRYEAARIIRQLRNKVKNMPTGFNRNEALKVLKHAFNYLKDTCNE